jgi:hypothetical protein
MVAPTVDGIDLLTRAPDPLNIFTAEKTSSVCGIVLTEDTFWPQV